jgi:hypothetical protein
MRTSAKMRGWTVTLRGRFALLLHSGKVRSLSSELPCASLAFSFVSRQLLRASLAGANLFRWATLRMARPHAAVTAAWPAMLRPNQLGGRGASLAAARDPAARSSTVAGAERGALEATPAERATPEPRDRWAQTGPQGLRVPVPTVLRGPADLLAPAVLLASAVRLGAEVPARAALAATPVHPEAMLATARRARLVPAADPLARVEWEAWVVRLAATRATFPWIRTAAPAAPAGRAASVPPADREAQAVSRAAREALVVRAGRAGAAEWRVPAGSMRVRRACRHHSTVWLAASKIPLTGSNGIERSWVRNAPAHSARRRARSRVADPSAQLCNASSASTERYRSPRHAGPRRRFVTATWLARRTRLASTAVFPLTPRRHKRGIDRHSRDG